MISICKSPSPVHFLPMPFSPIFLFKCSYKQIRSVTAVKLKITVNISVHCFSSVSQFTHSHKMESIFKLTNATLNIVLCIPLSNFKLTTTVGWRRRDAWTCKKQNMEKKRPWSTKVHPPTLIHFSSWSSQSIAKMQN